MEGPISPRLRPLIEQFDRARELSQARLEGNGPTGSGGWRQAQPKLTDEEYLWEPVSGAWSVRRRQDAATAGAFGPGEWVLDRETPEPDPAPFTTIGWRISHLHSSFAGRWEWTFGPRQQPPDLLVDFSPSADTALERFWTLMDRWRQSVAAMTPEQFDTPGFGQYPRGSDPEEPFLAVVWWTNLEFIHHMAEIGLLRDLWRSRLASRVESG